MTTVEVLRKAKAHIRADGWEKGAAHFADDTGPCCALGAIIRARRGGFDGAYREAHDLLFMVVCSIAGRRIDVTAWNDLPGTSLLDILAAFDRAIALATPGGVTPGGGEG